jgi:hypothetical protein
LFATTCVAPQNASSEPSGVAIVMGETDTGAPSRGGNASVSTDCSAAARSSSV